MYFTRGSWVTRLRRARALWYDSPMSGEYRTIYRGGEGEIEEKKSRFIAHVRPVKTEAEAQAFIEEIRKKYWDARHNCHAYVIGARNELVRSSDDGEPAGTAGRPILDVLLKEEIHDAAIVVTRYFGGTLLGTGGLVRAYTQAAQAGLDASAILSQRAGVRLSVRADYGDVGKLQYLFAQKNVTTLTSDFCEAVDFDILVPAEDEQNLRAAIADATGGRADAGQGRACRYGTVDGEVICDMVTEANPDLL